MQQQMQQQMMRNIQDMANKANPMAQMGNPLQGMPGPLEQMGKQMQQKAQLEMQQQINSQVQKANQQLNQATNMIRFAGSYYTQAQCTELEAYAAERGVIVTNPPYGERIMEKQEAEALYEGFGKRYRQSVNWNLYLLSSHTEFERKFGKQAVKKRKLYNGMIKCDLFMYF